MANKFHSIENLPYNTWDEAIVRVLGDNDRPMKTNEILEIIKAENYYTIVGATPENSLNRNLSQNKKLYASHGNGSYSLAVEGKNRYSTLGRKLKPLATQSTPIVEEKKVAPTIEVEKKDKDSYTKKDFLSEVFMTEEDYDHLRAKLENKKNIILEGAPGVGKTFSAKRLAYSMIGKKDAERICFVQFHQNYSYEDFIEGYKPVADGFELRKGIFYKFCAKASADTDNPYFFIIDEINRGNLSKIFGELLMLIETDYRGEKILLGNSGDEFSIPENLYIIGMMNTADRSLAMIDYALRRRFSFFNIKPGFNSKGFLYRQHTINNERYDKLISCIIALNKEITNDDSLGCGFEIGHSYLCFKHAEDVTDRWLYAIVNYDIIPLLNEYWFDNRAKVEEWSKNLNNAINGQ